MIQKLTVDDIVTLAKNLTDEEHMFQPIESLYDIFRLQMACSYYKKLWKNRQITP
ncbi:hypothetical protein VCR14J2_230064 [Vibrio coralliirubri]|nr:hypothetical protein VCR14J2_230064 [Vibrio coralliirubri]